MVARKRKMARERKQPEFWHAFEDRPHICHLLSPFLYLPTSISIYSPLASEQSSLIELLESLHPSAGPLEGISLDIGSSVFEYDPFTNLKMASLWLMRVSLPHLFFLVGKVEVSQELEVCTCCISSAFWSFGVRLLACIIYLVLLLSMFVPGMWQYFVHPLPSLCLYLDFLFQLISRLSISCFICLPC